MKAFFQNTYAYQHHFNEQLIEQLILHKSVLPERCIPLFSHVLNAQKIWNARILGLPSSGVFDVHPLETMQALALLNHQHSLEIIERFDLSQSITYRNTQGEVYSNTIQDLLFHVINHTTHHRGQIISDFRQAGIEPLKTDYVFYVRK
ncbi:MAG TPA: DinB family protein [Haliscomenobacter sp.]|uniref:DinB family protein n=1 Tax=Haliscomenobacter sp. TaxID=2717303 RepID=UPI002C17BF40|nr:DinB family protein [Haliscomenobacter sp.]HOY16799.1 DinB family protein [Haliscomenobacter sp.]HPH17411.1 DinB family protein [Haliscomenobacter sp.]